MNRMRAGLSLAAWIGFAGSAFAWGFAVGVKLDALTGLRVSYNGLGVESCFLTSGGERLTTKQVPTGATVKLHLGGVEGFVEEKGRVYPGGSLVVEDADGKAVFSERDAFAEYDAKGVSPADAKSLSLSLKIGSPIRPGQTYVWKSRFWDKRGKGAITSEVKIEVKLPPFLKLAAKGVTWDDFFLAANHERVARNEVTMGSDLALVLTGARGFVEEKGRVHVGATMTVTDETGKAMMDTKDLMADTDATGISLADAKTLSLTLTPGRPMSPGHTYTWKARFWDKKGPGAVLGEAQLKVTAATK